MNGKILIAIAVGAVLLANTKRGISAVGTSRNRKNESENIRSGYSPDYPVFTGGTYLHPDYLPELRTVRIQGGRFVNPRAGEILPPERQFLIEHSGYAYDNVVPEFYTTPLV